MLTLAAFLTLLAPVSGAARFLAPAAGVGLSSSATGVVLIRVILLGLAPFGVTSMLLLERTSLPKAAHTLALGSLEDSSVELFRLGDMIGDMSHCSLP